MSASHAIVFKRAGLEVVWPKFVWMVLLGIALFKFKLDVVSAFGRTDEPTNMLWRFSPDSVFENVDFKIKTCAKAPIQIKALKTVQRIT